MRQASNIPTAKVIAGGIAGALTTIIVWGVQQWGGVTMPAEIAVAVSTVLSFLVSWWTPPAERDAPINPEETKP